MLERAQTKIPQIFVGRQAELENLAGLWDLAHEPGEHLVYVFLNAPGVGKTTLIHHFGQELERTRAGLALHFRCKTDYDTPEAFHRDLLTFVQRNVRQKRPLLQAYIDKNYPARDREKTLADFEALESRIDAHLQSGDISTNTLTSVLDVLSWIIPTFLAADEIQELQKTVFVDDTPDEETALHLFSRLGKNLLDARLLLVLSGTRYHILSQIGAAIGSPLKGKVEPLVISRFSHAEMEAYVKAVRELVSASLQEDRDGDQDQTGVDEQVLLSQDILLDHFSRFLRAFSGGHPRTIEKTTRIFFKAYQILCSEQKFQAYDAFVDFLYPRVEEFLGNSLFSSDYRAALQDLQASQQFGAVKDWLLSQGTEGLLLGPRPTRPEGASEIDEELKRIVFALMNIGIILQNGQYNYYLTSQFHLNEFLGNLDDDHALFLRQVLHNRFFQLMCGSHAGFGYTFEQVFLAALLGPHGVDSTAPRPSNFPFDPASLTTLETLPTLPPWESFAFQPGVLYHTPSAPVVDFFAVQDRVLVLVQVTTSLTPDPGKRGRLHDLLQNLAVLAGSTRDFDAVAGWFISLFEVEVEPGTSGSTGVRVTSGDQLEAILGASVFARLRTVKRALFTSRTG